MDVIPEYEYRMYNSPDFQIHPLTDHEFIPIQDVHSRTKTSDTVTIGMVNRRLVRYSTMVSTVTKNAHQHRKSWARHTQAPRLSWPFPPGSWPRPPGTEQQVGPGRLKSPHRQGLTEKSTGEKGGQGSKHTRPRQF